MSDALVPKHFKEYDTTRRQQEQNRLNYMYLPPEITHTFDHCHAMSVTAYLISTSNNKTLCKITNPHNLPFFVKKLTALTYSGID